MRPGSASFRVQLTVLSPTARMITLIGDVGADDALVVRQAVADNAGPGLQLVVDLSRTGEVDSTALASVASRCIVVADGLELPGAHTVVATVDEAQALVVPNGNGSTGVDASELDIRTLRNRALIAEALELLRARYGLPDAGAAFGLLSRASQGHNVPVRTLAASVLRIAAPEGPTWFPGRRKGPEPETGFAAEPQHSHTPRGVLRGLLLAVLELTGLDCGYAQSVAPLDGGLVLEADRGLTEPLTDLFGYVPLTADSACARAHRERARVVVADLATDPTFGEETRDVLLAAGVKSAHCTPLITPDGRSLGAVSTLHSGPVPSMLDDALDAIDVAAGEAGRWLDWYQRTVVLDALENLHQAGRGYRAG